ncbi:MAG TPA: regulatory protein RecX [Bacteroidales bacterium]
MSPHDTFLLEKARKYCAYQERCFFDIKQKLKQWQASESTIEKIIRQLEREDFLNEERYAIAFAIGKFRNNGWGRNKILYAMTQKRIPELYIQMGLNEIKDEENIKKLKAILAKKKINAVDEFTRNAKLVNFAVQRGFQASLAWKVVKGEI